ncbi:hypothetical protein LTR84_003329 [Exophiala bonariae]|uniref:Telomere replication protein EST3 n=1 Tax=Exophiala bonariae TaxID=1690606 RepID=A0AAV9N7H7_9EURO|nr:hypothetical protein LTR84_003329 [Exophiala bonariae]
MEPPQPWLASFAITRLTDLLIHDEEDHKCDFKIKYLGGSYDCSPLDILQTPPLAAYGYITDVTQTSSQGNTRVGGIISDGQHTTKVKFRKSARNALLLPDKGNEHTLSSVGLVKLSGLGLRVTTDPPELVLIVDSIETVPSGESVGKVDKVTESLRKRLCKDHQIKSLLTRCVDHLEIRQQGYQRQSHTPKSIVSQPPLSPGRHDVWKNGTDLQTSSLNEPFVTQLPQIIEKSPSISPRKNLDDEPALPTPGLQDTGLKRRKLLKATREPAIEQHEPANTITTTATTTNTLPTSNCSTRPATRAIDPPLKVESKDKQVPFEKQSAQENAGFRQWRQESRKNKRLPRYIEKIPKAQLELLESDDAWQPPLVGRRSRPGDVPLTLLGILSKAADAPSELPAEHVDPSNPSQPLEQSEPTLPTQHELDNGDPLSPNESDSSSVIEWASSPPAHRRSLYLPPDSDPLAMPDIDAQSIHKSQNNGAAPTVKVHASEMPVLELVPKRGLDNTNEASHIQDPSACPPSWDISLSSAESGLKSSQGPEPSPRDRGQEQTSMKSEQTKLALQVPNSSVELLLPRTQVARTVQIGRTPYVEKFTTPQAANKLTASQAQTTGIILAHPTSSDVMPGTFSESALQKHAQPSRPSPPQESKMVSSPSSRRGLQDPLSEKPEGKPQGSQLGRSPVLVQATASNVDAHERGISRPPTKGSPGHHTPDPATRSRGQLWDMTALGDSSSKEATSPADKALQGKEPPGMESHQKSHGCIPTAKRFISNSDGNTPNKRRRLQSGMGTNDQLRDPAYDPIVQDIQMHRREHFQRFRKLSTHNPPSTSSSSSANGDSDVAMPTPPRPGKTKGAVVEDGFRAHTSTPLTGLSDSDEIIKDPKISQEHSVPNTNAKPTQITLESLSRKFAGLYTDYKGHLTDFKAATKLLKKMVDNETAPHPFLFDDAVFHHFHSYRQFLLEDVFNGEEPMTYDKFYRTRVNIPTHLQCVITVDILKSLLWVDDTYPHTVHTPHLQPTDSLMVKHQGLYDHELAQQGKGKEWAASPKIRPTPSVSARQMPLHNTGPIAHAGALADYQSLQSGSRGGSPELGTPEIDRSRSPRLPSFSSDRGQLERPHMGVSAIRHSTTRATISDRQSPGLPRFATSNKSVSTTKQMRDERSAAIAKQGRVSTSPGDQIRTSLVRIDCADSSISPCIQPASDERSLDDRPRLPGPVGDAKSSLGSSIKPSSDERALSGKSRSSFKAVDDGDGFSISPSVRPARDSFALASKPRSSIEQHYPAKSAISPSMKRPGDDRPLADKPRPSIERYDQGNAFSSASIKPDRDVTRRRSSGFKRLSDKRIADFPRYVVDEVDEWWKDPDTTVKRFAKQHSALPSEKRLLAAGVRRNINVFEWRP